MLAIFCVSIYLFWNNRVIRNTMDQCCILSSTKTTHAPSPEYIMTQCRGVDIALTQDRKSVLLYLSCDSKLLMFSFAGRDRGENAFLFQKLYTRCQGLC